jgi:hypothetical protein
MKIWRAALLGLAATVAVVIALMLTGVVHGLVLVAYVIFLAALLFAMLIGRLRRVLPLAVEFRRMLPPPAVPETHVKQFETVRLWVAIARYSRSDLYFRLRTPVRDIVSARLSRSYGVDLEREPGRAAAILGQGRAWELVRPDYSWGSDRSAPGWSEHEVEQLVDELERL